MLTNITNIEKKEEKENFAVYTITENGRITYISPVGADYFGDTAEAIIGKKESDLFTSDIAFDFMEINQRVLITGKPQSHNVPYAINSQVHQIRITKYPIVHESGHTEVLMGVVEKLLPQQTAVSPSTTEFVQLNQQFWALQSATTAISNSLNIEHIQDNFVWEMAHLLQTTACAYYSWQENEKDLLLQAKYEESPATPFDAILDVKKQPFLRQAVEDFAIYQFHKSARHLSAQERGFLEAHGSYSALLIPLALQGNLIGLGVVMEKTEDRIFAETETAVAGLFADQTASTILNAQLYSQLLDANAQLKQSNEDLDAFARTAAHDLKSPIGSIIGFADLIKGDYANLTEDEMIEFLGIISRSSHQMQSIIDNLLMLARVRQQEVEISPLHMEHIIPEVMTRLAYLIKESGAKVIIQDTWPVAYGYMYWIEEVWANYISNAIKYGGEPPVIQLGATPLADGTVQFWVQDNGKGLSLEAQKKLFIPFSRVNQTRAIKGHGLGLSIVQRIMVKLGGAAGVESELDRGSKFYFILPAHAPVK